MEASKEEQRGVVVSWCWGCWNARNSSSYVCCVWRTLNVTDKCARVVEAIPRRTHTTASPFTPWTGTSSLYALCYWADWWSHRGKPTNHRGTTSCSRRTRKCKSGWGCGSFSDVPLSTRLELIVSSPNRINTGCNKICGKLWGIEGRPKTSKEVHVNIWSIFLSFKVTGIICGVHNTDHFTIQVVHLKAIVYSTPIHNVEILSQRIE